MENINLVISENLKKIRENRKLSLDALSKLSGVSKSMLGQIERGEVNPTISTVWKIANGLKISFTEVMSRPEKDYEVIERESIAPLLEDGGKYRNFPIVPFNSERRFEMYRLELDAGSELQAQPHPEGTQEFITSFSGELNVRVNGENLVIKNGDSLRFYADRPHSYKNTGNEVCLLSLIIYYPKH